MTERKRAEEALRESEERFRGTFENAAVGIGHRHLDGRFLRVNQKFCTILGYPRDELLERTGQEITHPDDLDAGVDLAEALLRGESPGFTLETGSPSRPCAVMQTVWTNIMGQPVLETASLGHLANQLMWAQIWAPIRGPFTPGSGALRHFSHGQLAHLNPGQACCVLL
jgi:PAS domain-containing protein